MFRGEAASAATILRHGGLLVRQVETRYYLTPGQPRRQPKEILSRAEDSSNTGLAGSAERIEVHCNGQGVPCPYPLHRRAMCSATLPPVHNSKRTSARPAPDIAAANSSGGGKLYTELGW